MHTEVNLFEWLKMHPERLVTFNESMRAANQIRTKGVLDTLSRLLPDEGSEEPLGTDSEVLLVDVGGGKGDLLDRFRQQRPDLKGRLILQDLPNVVEGRQSQLDVEFMAHDFFETQPVRGTFSRVLPGYTISFFAANCSRGWRILLPPYLPQLA